MQNVQNFYLWSKKSNCEPTDNGRPLFDMARLSIWLHEEENLPSIRIRQDFIDILLDNGHSQFRLHFVNYQFSWFLNSILLIFVIKARYPGATGHFILDWVPIVELVYEIHQVILVDFFILRVIDINWFIKWQID